MNSKILMNSCSQHTIQMPACAIMAVPGRVEVSIVCMACVRRNSRLTKDEVELNAFSVLLGGIACSTEKGLLFSPTLGCGVLLWDACC